MNNSVLVGEILDMKMLEMQSIPRHLTIEESNLYLDKLEQGVPDTRKKMEYLKALYGHLRFLASGVSMSAEDMFVTYSIKSFLRHYR